MRKHQKNCPCPVCVTEVQAQIRALAAQRRELIGASR